MYASFSISQGLVTYNYSLYLDDSDFEIQRSFSTFNTYSFSIKVPKYDWSIEFINKYDTYKILTLDKLPGYDFIMIVTDEDSVSYSVNFKQREVIKPEKFGDMISYDQVTTGGSKLPVAFTDVKNYHDDYLNFDVDDPVDLRDYCYVRTSFPVKEGTAWNHAPLYIGSDTLVSFNDKLKSSYSVGVSSNINNMVSMIPIDDVFIKMVSPYMKINLGHSATYNDIYVGAKCIRERAAVQMVEVPYGKTFDEYTSMTEGTVETKCSYTASRAVGGLYQSIEPTEAKCFSQVLGTYKAPSSGWYKFVVDVEHTIPLHGGRSMDNWYGITGGSLTDDVLRTGSYNVTADAPYFIEWQLVKKGADHKPVTNCYNSAAFNCDITTYIDSDKNFKQTIAGTKSVTSADNITAKWYKYSSQGGNVVNLDLLEYRNSDYITAFRYGNPCRLGDTYGGEYHLYPQLLDFIVPTLDPFTDPSLDQDDFYHRIDSSHNQYYYNNIYGDPSGSNPFVYPQQGISYSHVVWLTTNYTSKDSNNAYRVIDVKNPEYMRSNKSPEWYQTLDSIGYSIGASEVGDDLVIKTKHISGGHINDTYCLVYLEEGQEYEFRQVTLGAGGSPLRSSTRVITNFIQPSDLAPYDSETFDNAKITSLNYSYLDDLKDVSISDFVQGIQEAYPEICTTDDGITDDLVDLSSNLHVDVDYSVEYQNAGKVIKGANFVDDNIKLNSVKNFYKKFSICEDYQLTEPLGMGGYQPPYVVKSDKNILVSTSRVPTLKGLVFGEYDEDTVCGVPGAVTGTVQGGRNRVSSIRATKFAGPLWRGAKIVTGFDQLSKVYKFRGVVDSSTLMFKPFKFEFKGDYYVCKEIDRLNMGTNYFEISCLKMKEFVPAEPIYFQPSDKSDHDVFETSDGDLFQLQG